MYYTTIISHNGHEVVFNNVVASVRVQRSKTRKKSRFGFSKTYNKHVKRNNM